MKPIVTALLSVIFFALMGGTSASAQAPRGEMFAGQTEDGNYVVIVRGDRRMDRREVASSALLRAAEVTLEADKQWFIVTSSSTQRIDLNSAPSFSDLAGAENTPGDAFSTGTSEAAQAGGHGATAGVDPGAVGVGTSADPRLLERRPRRMAYQTIMVIRAGSGRTVEVERPDEELQIFDAAAIAAQLSNSGE